MYELKLENCFKKLGKTLQDSGIGKDFLNKAPVTP